MKNFTTAILLLAITESCLAQVGFFPTSEYSGMGFGTAAAISGDKVVVSSYSRPPQFVEEGRVFLFELAEGEMTQTQVFDPVDVLPTDQFGTSVSVDGDFIAIGAPMHDSANDNAGAVYIYKKTGNTYDFLQKITAPNALPEDHFGYVKIAGNYLFIGASGIGFGDVGGVYIYQFDGTSWNYAQTLTVNVGVHSGKKIEVEGNTMIFSGSDQSGKPFFTYDLNTTWQFKNVTYVTAVGNSGLVYDFCLSNGQLFILRNTISTMTNEVLIFNDVAGEWTLESSLTIAGDDQIYTKIEVNGDQMFLGSTEYLLQVERQFPVRYYKKTAGQWMFENTLYGNGPENLDDYFGSVLTSDGNTLIIGAPQEGDVLAYGKSYHLDLPTLGNSEFTTSEIQVYPNPVNDVLTIKNSSPSDIESAKIYSAVGQLLSDGIAHDGLLQFGDFSAGMYFVHLQLNNGKSKTFKIIKN